MKIRLGHVSNSSSASFWIPAFLLTDEQKEIILSLDDSKETKAEMHKRLGGFKDGYTFENSKNNYPKNEEYHKIYEEMCKAKKWDDSWETGETSEKIIKGSTIMDNGNLHVLMEKMEIDLGIVQWNHQWNTDRATHPKAVEFFIKIHRDWFDNLTEKDYQFYKDTGKKVSRKSEYEMTEEEFKKLEEEEY